jgi:hypothetical protein
MVSVPSFFPPLNPAPAGTVFTIGRDDPAQRVRNYMNRPKNVLLKVTPKPEADDVEQQGGFIVDETAAELVFPLKFGKLLQDDTVIPATAPAASFQAELAPTTAVQVTDPASAPAPALSQPETALTTATPKKVVKQQPKATSSAQWPSRQSVINSVAAAVASEVEALLFAGNLESKMQRERKGTQKVLVTLPSELPCGKVSFLSQRILDCDLSSADRPYSSAIWQQLGESIQQRVASVRFDLWVDLFRGKGCVQARVTVQWGQR